MSESDPVMRQLQIAYANLTQALSLTLQVLPALARCAPEPDDTEMTELAFKLGDAARGIAEAKALVAGVIDKRRATPAV